MQAHSFFVGGLPMLFYGDEVGYTNDYSYMDDAGKNYDNRWMHRPFIDWEKNKKIHEQGTTENLIFTSTQKLIALRKKLKPVSDKKNITWMGAHNLHTAGYIRTCDDEQLFCLFNFSKTAESLTWYAFKEQAQQVPVSLYDHWQQNKYKVGADDEYFVLEPYSFYLLQAV